MIRLLLKPLGTLLKIQDHEWPKFILLFAIYLFIGISIDLGRNFAEAMVVAQVGVAKLPLMFVYSSIVTILVSLPYAIFADSIKNSRLLMNMSAVMVIVLVFLYIGIAMTENDGATHETPWLIYLLYISSTAFATISTSHIGTYLQDHYNPLECKRLLPLILTSTRFGGIIAGVLTSVIAIYFNEVLLILVWAIFLVVGIWLTYYTEKKHPSVSDIDRISRSSYRGYIDNLVEGYKYVMNSKFLLVTALSVFALYFLRNIFDYIINAMFSQIYTTRQELIAFYGSFTIFIHTSGALLQMLVTPRLIAWLRIGPAGTVFSWTSLISMLALGFSAVTGIGLWFSAAFARFNRFGLLFAFNNPIYALFFNAVPPEIRGRARGFITGLVLPLGTCASGILMLLLIELPQAYSIFIILGIITAVYFQIVSVQRSHEYSRALVKLLEEGKFDQLAIAEPNFGKEYNELTRNMLLNMFRGKDEQMTGFSAEILLEIAPNILLTEIPHKVLSPVASNALQKQLIGFLDRIEGGGAVIRNISQQMIEDDSKEVQALTIDMLDHYNIEATDLVRSKLASDSPRVKNMAIIYFLHLGNETEKKESFDHLDTWTKTFTESDKSLLIEFLGKTKDPRFLSRLFACIDISNLKETRFILQAMLEIYEAVNQAKKRDPEHFTKQREQELIALMHESIRLHKSSEIPVLLVKILALFFSIEGIPALTQYLGTENYELNDELIKYYRTRGSEAKTFLAETFLTQKTDQYAEARAQDTVAIILASDNRFKKYLEDYLSVEMEKIYHRYMDIDFLLQYKKIPIPHADVVEALKLFIEILELKISQTVNKIIKILTEMGDRKRMETVQRVIFSKNARHRAQALETLENISIPSIVKLLQPVISQKSLTPEIERAAYEYFGIRRMSSDPMFYRYACDNDNWIRAMAIEVVGLVVSHSFPPSLFAEIEDKAEAVFFNALNDRSPFVREAGCVALRRCGYLYQDAWENLANMLYKNNEPQLSVKAQAVQTMILLKQVEEQMLAQRVIQSEDGLQMQSTIEKTVALRRVPIFAGLNLEQLKTLSTICTEEYISQGEVLFAEDEPGDQMYVILEGKISIYRDYKRANQSQLAALETGTPIGEMSMFAENDKRSATAVAIIKTHVLTIKKEELQALIRRYPDISFSVIQGLNGKIRQSNDIIKHLEAELSKFKPGKK